MSETDIQHRIMVDAETGELTYRGWTLINGTCGREDCVCSGRAECWIASPPYEMDLESAKRIWLYGAGTAWTSPVDDLRLSSHRDEEHDSMLSIESKIDLFERNLAALRADRWQEATNDHSQE